MHERGFYAREREARRVMLPPEYDYCMLVDATFKCVCCGKVRPYEQRREPWSEVCMKCVRDAGFWNE